MIRFILMALVVSATMAWILRWALRPSSKLEGAGTRVSPVFLHDFVNGFEVSTTDLGPHAVEPAMRYETMVFKDMMYRDQRFRREVEGYTRRYGDLTDAARGHGEVIAELQGPLHIGGTP